MHLALEKLKMTFSSRPPHRRTILKDWENKCVVATKQHRCTQKHATPTSKYQFFETHTGGNTTHIVFEGEPAVILHAKNVKVGTSANGNPKDQVTIGRVFSPRSANH